MKNMGKWILSLVLSGLVLASCSATKTTFEPLPPLTKLRIVSFDTNARPYQTIVKTVTNAAQISQLVALMDAERADWSSTTDALPSTFTGIEVRFHFDSQQQRVLVVAPNGFSGAYGGEGNLATIDRDMGPSQWRIKKVSDAQLQSWLAAIGPVAGDLAPKARPTTPSGQR